MLRKITAYIEKYNMLSRGDTVCCALSGGADSTALLLVLCELSGRLGITVTAVHVNHKLRGGESDRDEAFCTELCRRLGVELKVFARDAAEFSRSLGVSVETGARELRYTLFDSVPADRIATAHNLNDNAETLLFRIARGTGLKGLCGIPPVRGKFIRPLLECGREEIEAFLAARGQGFVTDSTNLSDDYARNRIRHGVMPELSQICGGFPGSAAALTRSLSEDEDYLSKEAERCKCRDLRTLHPALRKRIIMSAVREYDIDVTEQLVQRAEKAALNGGRTLLGKYSDEELLFAYGSEGRLRFVKKRTRKEISPQKIEKSGEYSFASDKIVIISEANREKMNDFENVNKNSTTAIADCDKIRGSVVLRNRLRSDRIKPLGQLHTRELRKLLQERLPAGERDISAVIADSEGVIWAEHIGIAQRVQPDGGTEKVIKITIKDT